MKASRINVQQYSWGTLLVIEAGHAVTVIVHPEAFRALADARDRGVASSFLEETGRTWKVAQSDDGGLVFVTRGVSKVRLNAPQAAGLPVAVNV
jgi:hypothetical protein